MWIGTFGGGLNLAVKAKDKYVFKRFLNNFYRQRQIRVIQEDTMCIRDRIHIIRFGFMFISCLLPKCS